MAGDHVIARAARSRAAFSVLIYSIYLAIGGLSMALVPNVILSLAGHPTTSEPWVRFFGALACILGAKGINTSRLNIESLHQFDVYTRSAFAIFLVILVLAGMARPILLIWTVIDLAGSVWTVLALRADRGKAFQTLAA